MHVAKKVKWISIRSDGREIEERKRENKGLGSKVRLFWSRAEEKKNPV